VLLQAWKILTLSIKQTRWKNKKAGESMFTHILIHEPEVKQSEDNNSRIKVCVVSLIEGNTLNAQLFTTNNRDAATLEDFIINHTEPGP